MKDNESIIYNLVSEKIKSKYPDVVITNQKLPTNQERFPAVSIVLVDNEVMEAYSTFDQLETVSKEIFEFEVAKEDSMMDVKAILNIIDEEMNSLSYRRSYIGLIDNQEIKDIRRLARYEKLVIN